MRDLPVAYERGRILHARDATTEVRTPATSVAADVYFARPLYPVDSIWTFHAALRPTM